MTAERTGRMRDVVTTLQAEQDRIVRHAAQGVLVVQGGPGTGKTAGELAAALALRRPPDPVDDVVLLTPAEAKGLEFDSVVIADPAAGPHGPSDLYVAMTRATRSLGVGHPGPVPRELASRAERPVSSRRS